MRLASTASFQRDCGDLPSAVQGVLRKALSLLSRDLRYPSLRIKKLSGTEIWYGRISRGYRFTFQLQDDIILLRRAGTHAVLDAERRKKQ